MNIDRITHVINILSNIQPESWNYGTWAEHFEMGDSKQAIPTCGTVGCAAGWMGLDAQCRAEGFYIDALATPRFEGDAGTAAISKYLDISRAASADIFLDLHESMGRDEFEEDYRPDDVTPLHVANALQALLDA